MSVLSWPLRGRAAAPPRGGDATAAQTVRCVVLPRPDASNPYQRLLALALADRHVEQVPGGRAPTLSWALRVKGLDAVHLHWLEFLLHSKRGGPFLRRATSWGRTLRLLLSLRVLKARGVQIVWTLHNLRPHEPVDAQVEAAAYRAVLRMADAVLVHSRHAAERVVAEWGSPRRLVVALHGHYIHAYPAEERPQGEVRQALGLPAAARTFLIFGSLRRYKRVPEAIEAFIAHAAPDDCLLVVGDAPHPDVKAAIVAAAEKDPRVVVALGFVPDESVASWFTAADAMVLNYDEVLSSGALMLGLSMGLPVIAPAGGTPEEVAVPGSVETFAPGGLGEALQRVARSEWQQRRPAARAAAEACTWEAMADELVAVYRP